MNPSHIATLRDKLRNATNFQTVWEYFFDHIADDPEFVRISYRTRSDKLEQSFRKRSNRSPAPGRGKRCWCGTIPAT